MKIEVPVCQRSIKMMEQIFSRYTDVSTKPSVVTGKCIIHMYPCEDTINDEDDSSIGFVDALRFRMNIYDVTNNTVYKGACYNDNINLEVAAHVQIFKDLSTVIAIPGGCSFRYGQSVDVTAVKQVRSKPKAVLYQGGCPVKHLGRGIFIPE